MLDLILASTLKSALSNLANVIRWPLLLSNLLSRSILRQKDAEAIQTSPNALALLIEKVIDTEENYYAVAHSFYETGQSLCFLSMDPVRPRFFPELVRVIIEPGEINGNSPRGKPEYTFNCGNTTLQLRVSVYDEPVVQFERWGVSPFTLSAAQFYVLGSTFDAVEAVAPGEQHIITSLGPDKTAIYSNGILFNPNDPLHLELLTMEHPDRRNPPRADHDAFPIEPRQKAGIYLISHRLDSEIQKKLEDLAKDLGGVSANLSEDMPDLHFIITDLDGRSRSVFRLTNVEYVALKGQFCTIISLLTIIKKLPVPEFPVQTPARWFSTTQQEKALSVCVECLALYANNYAAEFNARNCPGCKPGQQQLPDEFIRHLHGTAVEQIDAALPEFEKEFRTMYGRIKMRSLVFSEVSTVQTDVLCEVFDRFMICGISTGLIRTSALYFGCKRGPIIKRVFNA